MSSTGRKDPFGSLRSIIEELQSRIPDAESDVDVSDLFDRLNDWVQLALQRRERSETIIASTRDAFIATDSDGMIVEWNDQAASIFDRSSEQAIGTPIDVVLGADASSESTTAPNSLASFLATPQRIELTGLRQDGSTFPAETMVLEPQRIGDRSIYSVFVRDITSRRRAQDAVQSSEALYHSLVDRLPINVTRKDRNGRITFANQPFCDLVGRSREDLLGKTDYDLFPQELADKYLRDDRVVLETGKSFHAIEENRDHNRISYFEVWKVPVRDASGVAIESQAVFWDVTERERNREDLARERDLLRTLMDSLPDLIYVKDPDGRFVMANEALRAFSGFDSDAEIVGATPLKFAPPHLAEQISREDREVVTTGSPLIDQEQMLRRADGQQRVFAVTKVPIRDSQGAICGLVGIDRDITNRKRNEEELRKARQIADAASQAKSDFLANMSHEIRTPLNGVIGITELLIAGVPPQEQQYYLEIVRDSGEALMVVINDILDFSKIEAGQLDFEMTVVDLHEALGSAIKPLALRAHQKGLELCCDIDRDVPEHVLSDPVRLRQIVTNLVGNAIKFTSQGEVLLKLERLGTHDDCVDLRLEVKDTGIGIPADKVDHIFESFAQADASTTRLFGGTGLGLAISSRLVEALGGKLKADSEMGVGTTFHFHVTLPVASGDRAYDPSSLTGCRVMIADPHDTNRAIVAQTLRSWSMDVVEVQTIEQAEHELDESRRSQNPIRVIVADADLNFAQRLEAEPVTPPIIELVAAGIQPKRTTSPKAVVAMRLIKPAKRSELCKCLLIVTGHDAAPKKPQERHAKHSQSPSLRVLLAEDSVVNQVLAVSLLKRDGHDVTVVGTGREAVEAHQQGDFDLILMDIQMPELDGLAATQAIRQQEQHTDQHVLILAMTAHAMTGDRQSCLDAGMDGYLSKPIRIDDLKTAIDQLTQSP